MAITQTAGKRPSPLPTVLPQATQFKYATIRSGLCDLSSYNRRDFFKISLITSGSSRLLYAHRDFVVTEPALVFTSPTIPFSWEVIGNIEAIDGYFCVFTESFIQAPGSKEGLQDLTVYKDGGNPVFLLDGTRVGYTPIP